MRAAFLLVVVFARREIILLGFALIVINMHRAISLRSECLPGRASWRIRGQDHHRVGKCMLTTLYASVLLSVTWSLRFISCILPRTCRER